MTNFVVEKTISGKLNLQERLEKTLLLNQCPAGLVKRCSLLSATQGVNCKLSLGTGPMSAFFIFATG